MELCHERYNGATKKYHFAIDDFPINRKGEKRLGS
jgi:hypothetical protein